MAVVDVRDRSVIAEFCRRRPAVHVDAAAQAAANALSRGEPGIYNVGEDDPTLSSEKARRLLGFDPDFRLTL